VRQESFLARFSHGPARLSCFYVTVQKHWPIMLHWLELREGPFDPEWHTAEKIAGAQCGTGELSGENIAWARQAIASYITKQ
jgi:hypothetical protein